MTAKTSTLPKKNELEPRGSLFPGPAPVPLPSSHIRRSPESQLDWCAAAQLAADGFREPFLLIDREGRIRLTNPELENLLGCNRYEILGADWSDWLAPAPGSPLTEARGPISR